MKRRWIWLLMLLLPLSVGAAGLSVKKLDVRLVGDAWMLDTQIDYQLSETALEALRNGVRLTFETHVELRDGESWFWDSDLLDLNLRYALQYHTLSGQYEVIALNGGDKRRFYTLGAALAAMGEVKELRLAGRDELKPGHEYIVEVWAALDRESLPLPLRPMSHFNSGWSLSSESHEWRFRP